MAGERRIGSEDSRSRERLLDAAEQLLQSQGHSAVSVRRIAAEAGVKRALVHYYFRSMEALFLEVLERAYERHFARVAKAAAEPNPMRGLWNTAFVGEAILFEIYTLPLANQFPSIRTSIAEFMTRSRRLQVSALTAALERRPAHAVELPPAAAIALFLRGIARELAVERHLGVEEGHAAALGSVDAYLGLLD
jgi:AcrR family transcriptional regulator